MTSNHLTRQFRQSAAKLLSACDDEPALRDAASQLFTVMTTITGLHAGRGRPEDSQESWTTNGKAISPLDAARCVLDHQRTARFLRGTYEAIKTALERTDVRPLQIVYAGCGPFAPFASAVANEFGDDEIQFTKRH